MTLSDIKPLLTAISAKINLPSKQEELSRLKLLSESSDFWQDQSTAQKTMQRISFLTQHINSIIQLQSEIDLLSDFQSILESSPDQELQSEFDQRLVHLEEQLRSLEKDTYLSKKYDDHDAIFSLHAGQGGTEAMDWTSMLWRMYQRYFDSKDWHYEVLDLASGEEAGIKSIYIKVVGENVYGHLRGEHGVHRLVRLSPFNANNLRQTSFAKAEVTPIIANDTDVDLRPEDVEFSAYRSGGHGGQNVNKVSTAVRLTHRPSGISVACQSQRSQEQNRLVAMEMLRSQLWAIKEEKINQEAKDIKGDNITAGWGRQIRSYVLHPYKLIKDTRTKYETSDTQSVLDGNLDGFISAEIKL